MNTINDLEMSTDKSEELPLDLALRFAILGDAVAHLEKIAAIHLNRIRPMLSNRRSLPSAGTEESADPEDERSDMAREIDDYSRRIEMVACDVQDGSNRLGQSKRSGSTNIRSRPTPDLPNPGRR